MELRFARVYILDLNVGIFIRTNILQYILMSLCRQIKLELKFVKVRNYYAVKLHYMVHEYIDF